MFTKVSSTRWEMMLDVDILDKRNDHIQPKYSFVRGEGGAIQTTQSFVDDYRNRRDKYRQSLKNSKKAVINNQFDDIDS